MTVQPLSSPVSSGTFAADQNNNDLTGNVDLCYFSFQRVSPVMCFGCFLPSVGMSPKVE